MSRAIDAVELRRKGYEVYEKYHKNPIAKEALLEIEKLIVLAPTIEQPTWISCEERLPTAEDANRFGEVLAITKNILTTYPYKMVRSDNNYFLWWMPLSALPEPPKGDG